ncbi:MAG TPA: hypothetical protein VGH31_09155, partial [Acidimicrobiales bacterium]
MGTRFRRHLPAFGAVVLLGSLWATTAMSTPASAATARRAVVPAPLSNIRMEMGPFDSSYTGGALDDYDFTSLTEIPY